MKAELKTIKVLASTVENLNIISSLTLEKQYDVVDRLASKEVGAKLTKIGKKALSKKAK